MSKNQLIGPFFFEDDTVNGENYLSMLQQVFIPEIRHTSIYYILTKSCSLCTSLSMYDTLSTIVFITGGLEEMVLFDGLRIHQT